MPVGSWSVRPFQNVMENFTSKFIYYLGNNDGIKKECNLIYQLNFVKIMILIA